MPSLTTVALPENAFQYNDDLHYDSTPSIVFE